ncbi:hypothetical protein Nm8I071_04210 [Nonomuraea sp. TT08I-71]|nr:hypothetical protein Nm8I071_04210 [Nonomuraea sp. TT08I-71]
MPSDEVPESLALLCPHCEKPSSCRVGGSVKVGGYAEDESFPLPTLVMLTVCEHCRDPIVVGREHFGASGYDDPFLLWPAQERPLNPAIPDALREDHREARTCFKAKAYKATVVMVRRLLEGVCREHQVSERNLDRSLEELKVRGIIDERLLEWAHGLRAMGNIGAHYNTRSVSRQDAEDALQLSEAILDYIYVLTAKFNQFKSRKQGNPPAPPQPRSAASQPAP